ncbi:hypothetical protein PV08_01192 [Exophiala spinifera]|uniref:Uncharacterized protein n=1 Tax=Exophiala spinifera TaxID=91928 RepID=A0A0D2A770_9EURO|nr:uncharacterized protein PV08_01192 [Exophiala spinifera]KIW20617.1 hypothetical protein PV08_01192 [Exophiala spinifera]
MPEAHGFKVTLISADGKDYVEFGNQSIGTPSRARVISSKVLAKDGEQFHIKIDFGSAYDHLVGTPHKKHRYDLRSSFRNPLNRVDEAVAKPSEQSTEKLPFTFGALIYISGQKKADYAQLLNPSQQNVVVKGRHSIERVGESSSNVVVKPWMFTERGIEAMLSDLDLSLGSQHSDKSTDCEVDEITDALKNATNTKHTTPGGQIVVLIRRCVVLGESQYAGGWHRAGENEDIARPNDNAPSITTSKSSTRFKKVKFMNYKIYDQDDDFYAKFVIQALDLPKLVNLNLATPNGEPITQRVQTGGGFLNSALSTSPLKRTKMVSDDGSESEHEESTNAAGDFSREEEGSSSDEESHSRKRRKALVGTPSRQRSPTAANLSETTGGNDSTQDE